MRMPFASLGVVLALVAGCATAKPVPLVAGPEATEFLVGKWTGSYDWPTASLWQQPRAILVIISAVSAAGEAVGEMTIRDQGRYHGQVAPFRLAINDNALEGKFWIWTNVRLVRIGNDRLEGEALAETIRGTGGPRLEKVIVELTRAK
jgi:hypothetical protein